MATIRHVTVTTPLDDELFLLSMHGNESLSRPFQFDLELLGETSLIESAALLGEHITVHLEIAGHAVRHFNGVVTRFAYAGAHGRFFLYRLTMRPWLWLLDHVAQNDIYQRLSIPELAHLVFRLNGFTDVNPDDLTGSYSEREYVVQYHESAFNFVTRWLEHEGIYYYFEHDETSHKICLADTSSKGATVKSYDKLPFRTASQAAREARDHFTQWHQGARVAPESYALDAFDYLKPKNDLLFNTPTPDRSAMGSDADFGSIIDANQNYVDPKIGEAYSRTRAEELRSSQELFEGSGNVRGLRPGALFELTDHPRKSLNRKYCVVGVYYSIQAGEFESDETRAEYQVHTNVQAIDANVHYRPPRTTRAPTVVGPETATVVGASGTELYSDELGRIKILFHWDRGHDPNQDASCWVRVAQPWAGTDYGIQFIPRVGQEVVVDFIAGDPDRPIVMGSVYNRNHMPPYPANRHPTQSGIRTRSSKGGGVDDYNELRFEDDKGHEEIHVQGQRDLTMTIKHDSAADIGHDASWRVKNNLSVKVAEGDHDTTVAKGAMRADVKESLYGVTAKEVAVSASEAITLRVGDVSIRLDKTSITLTVDKNAEIKLDLADLSIVGTTTVNINPPGVVPMGAAKLPDLLTRMCSPDPGNVT